MHYGKEMVFSGLKIVGNREDPFKQTNDTIHRRTFQSFSFFSVKRERESPHNPLSPLLDKTATANNSWDLVNKTTIALPLLSLSLLSLTNSLSSYFSKVYLVSYLLKTEFIFWVFYHPLFLTTYFPCFGHCCLTLFFFNL